MKKIQLLILFISLCTGISAQIKVVATTTVISDMVKEIGKDKVEVDYICRGDQDPHFVEILPSYMLKIRRADLFIKIGLGLELWSQQLIDGSRNSRLKIIDLSKDIEKKEIPGGKIDASQGDIHPYGNPHYWLDPHNAKIIAEQILNALTEESPEDSDYYTENFENYVSLLDNKISEWDLLMKKAEGKPIIFFHASWIYFADRYNLNILSYIEPKPGIPPTPSHNAKLFGIIEKTDVNIVVMENYYSDNAPKQLSQKTDIKVVKVPIAPFGISGINSYLDMMDYIVKSISDNI